MDFQERYLQYKTLADHRLRALIGGQNPRVLYEPTEYILGGGGKRIRPVLVMFASEAVGGSGPDALDAGVAVELLHAFTLVHDDIMDRAQTRRGRQTVHTKWDEDTAILVGDVLIGIAQKTLLATIPKRLAEVVLAFADAIIDVCEGQALDKEYETRGDVTLDDYRYMIAMKTGRLVETAAEIGGHLGEGTPAQIAALRGYARHVGLAFQMQDDLLDITADEAQFGKVIGGDIVKGKKTYLLVRALELVGEGDDAGLLKRLVANRGLPAELVPAMRDLFERNGILDDAREGIGHEITRAGEVLLHLPDTPARDALKWLAQMIMNRTT